MKEVPSRVSAMSGGSNGESEHGTTKMEFNPRFDLKFRGRAWLYAVNEWREQVETYGLYSPLILFSPVLRLVAAVLKLWYDGWLTFLIETCAGFWYMFALPFQLAFQNPVVLDDFYFISYTFDGLLLVVNIYPMCALLGKLCNEDTPISDLLGGRVKAWHGMRQLIQGSSRRVASVRSATVQPSPMKDSILRRSSVNENTLQRAASELNQRRKRRRKAMCKLLLRAFVHLLPYLPFDVCLWGSASQWLVPYVRFIRLLYAPKLVHDFHSAMETSQLTSFTFSRYMRVLVVFAFAAHWLGCTFFYISERTSAVHYDEAPWVLPTGGGEPYPKHIRYLWANYWSMMSLTTTGHVDIVDEAQKWEVVLAMIVVFFCTFCFTYMNANITSLIMRHTQTLDKYRVKLTQVDNYLKRNHVSKDVRRLVKRHFEHSFEDERLRDQELLHQMPHALRKKVMFDIHWRTLRRVPIFLGCDLTMVQHICNIVKRVVVLPDTTLCTQGDVMTEMYFLEAGLLSTYEEAMAVEKSTPSSQTNVGVSMSSEASAQAKPAHQEAHSPRRSSLIHHNRISHQFDADFTDFAHDDGQSETGTEKTEKTEKGENGANDGHVGSRHLTKGMSRAHFNIELESAADFDHTTHSKSSKPESKLIDTPGSSVAEAAFVFGVRQDVTVEAMRPSSCLVLDKGDYTHVLSDFPEAAEKVCFNVKQRLHMLEKWSILAEIERTHGKSIEQMQSITDMFAACAKGDLSSVQEAVKVAGISLAETDYEGRSCLHIAASAGHVGVVEWLLSSNIAVNKTDVNGHTPLELALEKNHIKVVKLLREKGGTLGWDAATEGFHLCDAIRLGHLQKLKLLLDCGVSPDSTTFDQRGALHHAAADGNIRAVEILLHYSANLNTKDRWGGTPLREAVRAGHNKVALMLKRNGAALAYDEIQAAVELCEQARTSNLSGVRLLMDCGVDPNAADYDKRTALHLAASTGNMSIAKHLIKRLADVNARDRWGCTPSRDAIREGHRELALLLHEHGGALLEKETDASIELCELARQGDISMLEVLIKCGARVDASDYNKRTCLHVAAQVGNTAAVQLLLSNDANVNATDSWGATPLRDAVRSGNRAAAVMIRNKGGELAFTHAEASTQMCELTFCGSIDLLELLIDAGVPIDATDFDKRTCLHLAAALGNQPIVTLLLEHKANINQMDRYQHTPLLDALRHGHLDLARLLHSQGAILGLNEVQMSGRLCELVRHGNMPALKTFLDCDADVNVMDHDKRTGLHLAASGGNRAVVEVLIEARANVSSRDRNGNTPLRNAVHNSHYEVAILLHENGAELGLSDELTSAELCEFARAGDHEAIKIILMCGANVNAADYDRRSCLHVAACEGALGIVRTLVESKADVNFLDRWGSTALRDAVHNGHSAIAKYLREHGGDLAFTDKDAASELCDLAKNGSTDVIRTMIESGVNVNAADYDLRTCLHIAASEGMPQVVDLLVACKADINAVDRWGNTPLADALRSSHKEVMSKLIEAGSKLVISLSDAAYQMCNLARDGKSETLADMLKCGAPVDASDYDGRTPLHLAASEGHKSVVAVLLKWNAKLVADRWGNTPQAEAARSGHNWDSMIRVC